MREEGQLVLIEGQPYPRSVGVQRQKLAERVKQHGFEQTMEAAAYTWFNRLIAIRFMELHGYLDHSFRVLSHPAGQILPEILGHAEHLDLPGLDRERVIALKMDGNRDEDLYRDLLLAQCRALHRAMRFLFERVDDETELLLPDNLLQTDSLIRDLVGAIPEEDWQEVEIIGWLYQFYISEKKDQVIGKVVKSEDIPAATQLFTPNWIVQYLVQNSVGRQWLMANPASTLKSEWPYYIEPAEQTPEVQAQLDALIALRCCEEVNSGGEVDSGQWIVDSGGEADAPPSDYPLSTIHYPLATIHYPLATIHYPLNPETITVLDPACGSGHILVVAYDVLKAIYLERGYRPRDIPRLILEKNLYGLDIDDRAAQLAGFALLMKARADDRRLFDDPPRLNVLALQESKGLDARDLVDSGKWLVDSGRGAERAIPLSTIHYSLSTLLDTFAEAKTFGSLIQIPPALAVMLPELDAGLLQALGSDDVFARAAAEKLLPLVRQGRVLAMKFDAVVANPPYMGGKGINGRLKGFAKDRFPDSKSDLFAMFIERGFAWCLASGFNSMVTMQSWMFLSSFESMRKRLLTEHTISSFMQIGYNSFPEINSKVAQACAFSTGATHIGSFAGRYVNLNSAPQSADKSVIFLERTLENVHDVCQDDFKKISGSPIAYWLGKELWSAFAANRLLGDVTELKQGLATADNDRFLRLWQEVSQERIEVVCRSREYARNSGKRWFPHSKGGAFRKWYGNREWLVNWENDGDAIRKFSDGSGRIRSRAQGSSYYFRESLTWTLISSLSTSFRYEPYGNIISHKGPGIFADHEQLLKLLALLNSCVSQVLLKILAPTIGFEVGQVAQIPIVDANVTGAEAVDIAREDWDSSEVSWDFKRLSWIFFSTNLSDAWSEWSRNCAERIARAKFIEEENNCILIEAYGLQAELSQEVPEDQITLTRADREKDCQRLISYAIGCMMGRYRLDRPGLIYAHSGNQGFKAIYSAAREESTDDTDEHRLENEHLCSSVSSVDNHSSSAIDGIIDAAGEESTDDTDEHRLRNEHLCTSVSSVDKNPFPADADGIIPITEANWFDDDAANRIREFLLAVWPEEVDSGKWIVNSEDDRLSTIHYPLSTIH